MAGQLPAIPQARDHCTQQRVSKAFRAMKRAVRLKQTGALILQRMLHRRLAAAWCTWLDMVAVRQSAHCAGSTLLSPRVGMHPEQHTTCWAPGLPWRSVAPRPTAVDTSCSGIGAGVASQLLQCPEPQPISAYRVDLSDCRSDVSRTAPFRACS